MNVQLPDNSVIQFPDGMPNDKVNAAITNYLGQQSQPTQEPQAIPSDSEQLPMGEQVARQLGLAGRYMIQGPTQALTNYGDIANTGINAATSEINKYAGTNIQQLGMPSQDVDNLLTKVGYPTPDTQTEKLVGYASKLAAGLTPNGEASIATGKQALGNALDMVSSEPTGPTTSAAAKAIASQYYQQAQDTGGVLKPSFTNDFVDQLSQIAPQTAQGKIIAGDTPITQLVQRAQALRDQPLSLPAVQEIDEHLGNLVDQQYGLKGLSKDGRNILNAQSTLRDMVQNASPDDVVGGTDGFDALSNGRQAWNQASKMQQIEKIQNRAAQSDNPATTIKSGVRTLLSNPSYTRGWSDDEISALKNAGDRGVIGGALQTMGSGLVPYVATAVGEGIGGLPGAAIGGGIGHVGSKLAKSAGTALQNSRLADVLTTMGKNIGGQ